MVAQVVSPDELAAELARLRPSLPRRRYAKGAVIFLRGDPGTCLYLIAAGRVKITLTSTEGKEVVLALLGPGEFFGELALLDGAPRSADAVAAEASELLLLPREAFLRLVQARPGAALRLLAVVAERLRQDVQVAQDVAFLDVPGRLAKALLQLAATRGQPGEGGVVITDRLSQVDLAGLVGATRESVNKSLRHFVRQGLIHCHQGQITVLRPEGLRRCLS